MNTMNHVITWFELPVTDMERAKNFYRAVLKTDFLDEEMDGLVMSVFSGDEQAVSGMLVLNEHYEPSSTGAVIYFNGGQDLSEPLERAIQQGATVIMPKTAICDGEKGHFAVFTDSEGNRVGLYSYPQS